FLILAWFMKPQGKPQKQDIPFIIVFGVCNFAFSYLCLYYATMLSSAAMVTLIFSLKVILTPIALRIFLKEPLHRRVLLGGILGVMGVGVLIYPTLHSFSGFADFKGILIAFLGTLLTAIGDASSARNAKRQIDPIYANAIGFAVGSVVMCGIVWMEGQKMMIPTSITYLSALLYLTVIASFLAWLFYLKLVERIGGAKSGYMVALFPVIGGIASVLIGESTVSIYLIVGCLSSCIGAAIALGFKIKPILR
ncbi:MAG TPA: EamA family transporter, partial [Lysinibacillus sp.]|nr:EamA family transporter [Lysinibacillus sp.]